MKFIVLFCISLTVCIQASKYDSFVHPLSDEFIDLVNEIATTWKAGRNFHQEISMKQIKGLMGTFLEPKMSNRPSLVHEIPDDFDLPESFDAREVWPSCPTIGEIRDQGTCGSCWATASVEVMSDRMCILSNGEINFRYSTEDVLSCCGWSCGDCYGGFVDVAFDYWINTGIVSGGPYGSSQGCSPYQKQPCEHYVNGSRPDCFYFDDDTPSCQRVCQPAYDIAYEDDLHFGEKYYELATVTDAQYELIKNGPIVATMIVYEDFLSYKSGVYVHKTGLIQGGHAIKILGYGVENGTDYWLCANSWNTDWGDNGFFKILKGNNECNIEKHLSSGIPKFS